MRCDRVDLAWVASVRERGNMKVGEGATVRARLATETLGAGLTPTNYIRDIEEMMDDNQFQQCH